jgi:hypothetical protein
MMLLASVVVLAALAWWPTTLVVALKLLLLILLVPVLLLPGPAWPFVLWLGWEIYWLWTRSRRRSGDAVMAGLQRRTHQTIALILTILTVPVLLWLGLIVVLDGAEYRPDEIGIMESWSVETYSLGGLWLRCDPEFMARYRAEREKLPGNAS